MEYPYGTGGVRGVLHVPEHPTGDGLALTHGAGSDAGAPLVVGLARVFCEAGLFVMRYDLPFRMVRATGPPSPAHAPQDRAGIVRAVDALRLRGASRIFAGGHSYGGRQTAMLAAVQPGLIDGLLLLSYPLHPPGKPDQPRTDYFPELRTPAVFVHGTRDPFGTLDELRAALALIPARTDLIAVEGAGHDLLKVARTALRSTGVTR